MNPPAGLRVLLLGATGTIGQATAQALRRQGHSVVCLVRPRSGVGGRLDASAAAALLPGCTVRTTAFFKSLSGQVERVRRGQPFLLMGDGRLTACKPVSDRDLGDFIAGCLTDPDRYRRVLPIGGPGPAITPREQGERLFELFGQKPRFRQVPVAVLDGVIGALRLASRFRPSLADKAELASIGRYYGTESMLVWDAVNGRYDEAATPSTGSDTLWDHYAALARGEALPERGDHAVF